ncbi:MAG: mechanosensitive ion channel family protein [Actinomycetes bacterium]
MPDAGWTQPIAVLGGTVVVALVAGWLSGLLATRLAPPRLRRLLAGVHQQCHRAWTATLLAVGLLVALPAARLPAAAQRAAGHAAAIFTIGAVSWLAVKTLYVAEAATLLHVRVDVENNRRARKMRTQIATLRRLAAVVITVIAVAAILMTFDTMRAYGASVLASAGVAGVVAGLAAQTTLANVFAGLQLVFTDAARIDDVIVVEDEWGRIEELTLTYVVVHLWDERRLILPSSYFTTKPFQNWTRAESRVLGAVVLHVDPTAPIAALRNKAREVIEAHPLWDRRDWALQVVDTTETTLVVRVLASAADAPSAWDLRCDVREQLVAWLQSRHPAALPRLRTQLDWPTVDVSREASGFTRRQPPVP